ESFEAAVEMAGIEGGPVEGVFIRAPWVESVGAASEEWAEGRGPAGGGLAGARPFPLRAA
ncbi:pyridoxal 5'-phosphate synthase glutaminase subunit PdxT, partial [Streptomyces sp. NPDC056796]